MPAGRRSRPLLAGRDKWPPTFAGYAGAQSRNRGRWQAFAGRNGGFWQRSPRWRGGGGCWTRLGRAKRLNRLWPTAINMGEISRPARSDAFF